MTIRNLDRIFKPARVAVVGASDALGKVGQIVLRNLVGHGFGGVVYPVNPKREAVQGIAAYPNLSALPHAPDLAVICMPAPTVPDLVNACGRLGIMVPSIGLACYSTAEHAVRAFTRLLEFRRNRDVLLETPRYLFKEAPRWPAASALSTTTASWPCAPR